MQKLNNRRGGSAIGIIVGLVVLALVAGGIWFFVSKPFQTNVKQAYNQATQWTPENIKKDPVGYLTWALDEVGKTQDKLQASELSLKTKKNATARALQKQTADQSDYEKLLSEFKEAYTIASEQKKWPTRVRNTDLDEMALKRKIVECNDKIKNTAELVDTYAKTNKLIGDKLGEIEAKLAEVEKLKNKLSTNMEIAKVNQSVDDIGAIGDQLNAIVDTSSALAKTAEEGTSVADMIKPSGDARVNDEFSKIMGKSK
ncbi:MAG: hypothetical protein ACLP9L_28910 [Thermoguttaceae bacterium]